MRFATRYADRSSATHEAVDFRKLYGRFDSHRHALCHAVADLSGRRIALLGKRNGPPNFDRVTVASWSWRNGSIAFARPTLPRPHQGRARSRPWYQFGKATSCCVNASSCRKRVTFPFKEGEDSSCFRRTRPTPRGGFWPATQPRLGGRLSGGVRLSCRRGAYHSRRLGDEPVDWRFFILGSCLGGTARDQRLTIELQRACNRGMSSKIHTFNIHDEKVVKQLSAFWCASSTYLG